MSPAKSKPSQIRVRQVKSAIGGNPAQRNTIRSLGLKHVGDEVVRDDRPETRGMIQTVRHLVAVEEVE